MPNDARIEELIEQVVQHDGGKTTVHERLREALRTAIREAREEQIRLDAGIAGNSVSLFDAVTSITNQLPTKKG